MHLKEFNYKVILFVTSGENLQELEDSKNSMKCFIEELNELKNTHIL